MKASFGDRRQDTQNDQPGIPPPRPLGAPVDEVSQWPLAALDWTALPNSQSAIEPTNQQLGLEKPPSAGPKRLSRIRIALVATIVMIAAVIGAVLWWPAAPVDEPPLPNPPVELPEDLPGAEVCATQTDTWIIRVCTSDASSFSDVLATDNGTLIAVGDVYSHDGDLASFVQEAWGVLAHIDPTATATLDMVLSGTYQTIASAPDGTIVAAGTFYEDSEFTPVVDKLDAAGRLLWRQTLGGAQFQDGRDLANQRFAVTVGTDGGIILLQSGIIVGQANPLLMKFSPDGTLQWAHDVDQTSDGGHFLWGVTEAVDGSIYVVGQTDGTGSIFPDSSPGSAVVKFSAKGKLIWAKTYGELYFSSVAAAANGGIVTGGASAQTDNFPINKGSFDASVAMINPAGNLVWATTLGGSSDDRITDIDISPDGHIIVVGFTFSADGDFSGHRGTSPQLDLSDAFVARLTTNGTLQWAKTFGGSDADGFNGVFAAPNGDIVAVGRISSTDGNLPTNTILLRLTPTGDIAPR